MNRATREAILRRVAASPSAAALVLRGGMRTRLLCPEVPRVVEDVDFLARFPFSLEETAARLRQALALPVADGVEVAAGEAHLLTLEDASEKLTLSAPLDEPDDRAHERRPMARIVASIDPLLASKARVRAWLALGLLHGAHF